jgi:hypothetical protein
LPIGLQLTGLSQKLGFKHSRQQRVYSPLFDENETNRIQNELFNFVSEIHKVLSEGRLDPIVLLDELMKLRPRMLSVDKSIKDLIRAHNEPSEDLEEFLSSFFLYPEELLFPSLNWM